MNADLEKFQGMLSEQEHIEDLLSGIKVSDSQASLKTWEKQGVKLFQEDGKTR